MVPSSTSSKIENTSSCSKLHVETSSVFLFFQFSPTKPVMLDHPFARLRPLLTIIVLFFHPSPQVSPLFFWWFITCRWDVPHPLPLHCNSCSQESSGPQPMLSLTTSHLIFLCKFVRTSPATHKVSVSCYSASFSIIPHSTGTRPCPFGRGAYEQPPCTTGFGVDLISGLRIHLTEATLRDQCMMVMSLHASRTRSTPRRPSWRGIHPWMQYFR